MPVDGMDNHGRQRCSNFHVSPEARLEESWVFVLPLNFPCSSRVHESRNFTSEHQSNHRVGKYGLLMERLLLILSRVFNSLKRKRTRNPSLHLFKQCDAIADIIILPYRFSLLINKRATNGKNKRNDVLPPTTLSPTSRTKDRGFQEPLVTQRSANDKFGLCTAQDMSVQGERRWSTILGMVDVRQKRVWLKNVTL